MDKWFDASNFNKNDNRPLEIGKNKKVLGKFNDEIGGKIMTKFVALRAKTYSFLTLYCSLYQEQSQKIIVLMKLSSD